MPSLRKLSWRIVTITRCTAAASPEQPRDCAIDARPPCRRAFTCAVFAGTLTDAVACVFRGAAPRRPGLRMVAPDRAVVRSRVPGVWRCDRPRRAEPGDRPDRRAA